MKTIHKFSAEIPSGLQPSRAVEKQDLWEDGNNIIFQEGAVQPGPGQYLLLPKQDGEPAIGICEARFSDGTRNLFVGTLTHLWHWLEYAGSATDVTRDDGGTYAGVEDAVYDDVTPSWAPATQWSMVSWGDTIIATNGLDEMQVFTKGDTAFDDYSDVYTGGDMTDQYRVEILGKIGPFLILFNWYDLNGISSTLHYPFSIRWCDEDDLDVWTAAVDNAAGELEVRDLGSPIICAKPFASGYAVYGNHECRFLEFIGAPDYFGIRPLLSGIGALSKHSVVSIERLQYGMGTRGIWVHDGSQVKYIDTPDIHDYIYEDINQDQVTKCCVGYDSIEQLVLFFWPSTNSNAIDRCAAFNRQNGTWTKLGYHRTSYAEGHVWEGALTGSADGDIFLHSGIGFAPVNSDSPLVLPANVALTLFGETLVNSGGYGFGGYGKFYYGGTTPTGGIDA